MSSQRVIMESWRSFLLEDARNQEAGILTGAFMKILVDIVKSATVFAKETNTSVNLETMSLELAGIDENVKSYIKKSGGKKSKFLNEIESFNVKTEVKDSNKPFAFTIVGGGFNAESKRLNINISLSGKIDPNNVGNNMKWVDKAKLSLQELSQHELEHIAQKLSGKNIAADTTSGNIAAGRDSRELIQKLKDFLFKPTNKSEFAKKLKNAKKIINYLNKNNEEGAVDILTYYSQPAEMEAYVVGFVRRAKISASNIIKKDPSKKSVKNELVQGEFFELFDNHIENMLNSIKNYLPEEYKNELAKYVENISNTMVDYAIERYGFLRK